MSIQFSLGQLGWRPFFQQQLTEQERQDALPARIGSVHGNTLDVLSERGPQRATLPGAMLRSGVAETVAVGDWALIDPDSFRVIRLLERQSVLARLAAGESNRSQLIAANVDTLFVVTSCNDDFNASRLERYLALACDARVEPVVILTKTDLCTDVDSYMDEVRAIARQTVSVPVNAISHDSIRSVDPWLTPGGTVAFVGSSGVGKSTLINTLLGETKQTTAGIREDDAKGRHTTTSRQMFALPGGAWVIDTPGMRELKIGAIAQGVESVFDDVEALAQSCRFRDCSHIAETGCAVRTAINAGQLEERRLLSYQKLQREAAHATMSLRDRRERDRQFGRMAKSVLERKQKERGKP